MVRQWYKGVAAGAWRQPDRCGQAQDQKYIIKVLAHKFRVVKS